MNTRRLAAQILVKILDDGYSLSNALDSALSHLKQHSDRAFIQALCYGVCRHYYQLDHSLNQLLSKPIKDAEIRALALVGIYQLEFMRVKPYAAISETVAGVGKKTWAKSLLNALLRNYQRQHIQLKASAEQNVSAATNHPAWLIQQIKTNWPKHAEYIFAENNQAAPLTLRVNALKISPSAYLEQLQHQAISANLLVHCPNAITLDKPTEVERLPGFNEGWFSVQDSAAQLAADLLAVQPGDRVLDVCAAPGGKTCHLLENQPELAHLIALDIDEGRMQRVKSNLQRLQLHANTVIADASLAPDWWDGVPFQRILLDAPCSALGVIRRHPDIKLLRRETDLAVLQQLQQTLLHQVWPLLARGGILLYATCSILKQENEQQALDFLANHSDAVEWPIASDWGLPQQVGKQIITGESGMDGFYYARFKKQ